MSERLFGTDGVRGLANGLLTANLATSLGVAAAQVLTERGELAEHDGLKPFAIVGRDSRISGDFLQAAVSAGLASVGVDVIDVGVIPTPAIAYLTSATGADLGVMLSASHNPMPDNGIKFFARGGVKLDDVIEDAIEAHLSVVSELPTGAHIGSIRADSTLTDMYIDHVLGTTSQSLKGLTVVIDGANGAASVLSPEIFRRAGARVISIHCEPDGLNINDNCGSTHLESLINAVREHKADFGIAHDGDADRCLAVDATGSVVDGDHILAMLAIGFSQSGKLTNNTVVSTVMANLGFSKAMREASITVVTTAVGDRYVLEEMRAHGHNLGGEQSGHIVMSDHSTTGDGILTGLHIGALMAKTGKSLAELAATLEKFPQVLVNVSDVDKNKLDAPEVVQAVAQYEAELADTGRIVLRSSGTEPVIRVMVEAATQEIADDVASQLAAIVRQYCAL